MEQQLIPFIQTIISLAPAMILIWKMSSYVHQVNENKKDIDNLGIKLSSIIEKMQNEYSDSVKSTNLLHNNIIEILSAIEYLKKDITEIKNELKENRRGN